jgi:hypothetical protein
LSFASAFETSPYVERLLRVRHNGLAAHSLAIILVVLATLVRWRMNSLVGLRVPFITYFPKRELREGLASVKGDQGSSQASRHGQRRGA